MNFDSFYYPYPSRRMVVYAQNGMVATSQCLAAQAGLDILKKGGNAIDAAIATAACLTVLEPTSNGIGGDVFALIWTKGKLHGLNSSGPAPRNISLKAVKELGYEKMPNFGWLPVTVPEFQAAWAILSESFGRIPFGEVLKPAINYADKGFPVSSVISNLWKIAYQRYKGNIQGEVFKYWFETFAPWGRAPEPGEIWRLPDQAQTLQSIADSKSKSFYKGELAEKIDSFSSQYGGFLTKEDLADFSPEWVNPINVNYRGCDVWEIPPNGQGLVALIALNILNGFEFTSKDDPETYHKQIEAMKLAFSDGKRYITESKQMKIKVEDLLSPGYAEERRKLIGKEALTPYPGRPPKGGTVYLATADSIGNMVSYIQSNYMGFGSGLVVPGTGISLQNRGSNFSLNPLDANCLQPGKRTYHTIIPGFLTKGKEAVGPFGIMGGFMQPQGHVQVIMNTIDFKLNPQAALDAPRWQWIENKKLKVEQSFPKYIAESLARKGHIIEGALDSGGFGRGQIIWRNDKGVLIGATEPRADGVVAAW